jgi:crotonobetainyl-CoA:carnitine CoA-transferase CaiB-like acyl-CoA transferase
MSKVGFSAADISAGMYALSGILAALVRRERTGLGATVRVSMLDTLAEWMSAPLYGAVYAGGQPARTGRRHHAIAPYGTFVLGDGSTVLIAVQSDAEWRRLALDVLNDEDLAADARFATNPNRIANVVALEEKVAAGLVQRPAADVVALLQDARIATARVNDLSEVWEHPQLRARGRFSEVDTETGPVEMLVSPFDISGWTPRGGRVPGLDEHDRETLPGVVERGGPGRAM